MHSGGKTTPGQPHWPGELSKEARASCLLPTLRGFVVNHPCGPSLSWSLLLLLLFLPEKLSWALLLNQSCCNTRALEWGGGFRIRFLDITKPRRERMLASTVTSLRVDTQRRNEWRRRLHGGLLQAPPPRPRHTPDGSAGTCLSTGSRAGRLWEKPGCPSSSPRKNISPTVQGDISGRWSSMVWPRPGKMRRQCTMTLSVPGEQSAPQLPGFLSMG